MLNGKITLNTHYKRHQGIQRHQWMYKTFTYKKYEPILFAKNNDEKW